MNLLIQMHHKFFYLNHLLKPILQINFHLFILFVFVLQNYQGLCFNGKRCNVVEILVNSEIKNPAMLQRRDTKI